MSRFSGLCCLFAGLVALVGLGGCGDPLNRQPVSGEVKLKGQPIEEGIILFAPMDSQSTGEGAKIENGKYEIPKNKGLTPGKYKISIYAGDGRSGQGNASPDSPYAGHKPGKERVPPDYNEKSKIIKEVTNGGPNKINFEIP
jgi:hypothetical protein